MRALAKLKNFDTGSLLQKNMIFMDYLQNGITVKFFVKGEEQSSIVRLIDYANAKNNSCDALKTEITVVRILFYLLILVLIEESGW